MKPKTLGTIFASEAELARDEAFCDKQRASVLKAADLKLSGLSRETVAGEVRYYLSAVVYATVSRSGALRWFQTRADGDYSIPAPKRS